MRFGLNGRVNPPILLQSPAVSSTAESKVIIDIGTPSSFQISWCNPSLETTRTLFLPFAISDFYPKRIFLSSGTEVFRITRTDTLYLPLLRQSPHLVIPCVSTTRPLHDPLLVIFTCSCPSTRHPAPPLTIAGYLHVTITYITWKYKLIRCNLFVPRWVPPG